MQVLNVLSGVFYYVWYGNPQTDGANMHVNLNWNLAVDTGGTKGDMNTPLADGA